MAEKPAVAVLLQPKWRDDILGPEGEAQLRAFATVRDIPGKILEPADVGTLLEGASACITGWETPPISEADLSGATTLAFIAHTAGTIRSIVPKSFGQHHIRVSQATHQLAYALAEHVVAEALLALQHLHDDDQLVRDGGWADVPQRQRRLLLGARTVGIWGMGRAGQAAARLFGAFGCEILHYDPVAPVPPELGKPVTSLRQLFERCDVVCLLAPLLPETRGLVDADLLAALHDGSVLINAGRGPLVNEQALIDELKSGRISAALDVFDQEPLPPDHALRQLPNVVLSPHVGGHTRDTHRRQGRDMVEDVRRYLAGEPLQFEVTPFVAGRLA
jgi:phosphoglycerate dehydrogenase-like enzyme